ncbi:MAG TPA: hypothetical protein VFN57_00010 [Thermomicrobiaceae bacterium]|nr:hypothetical protein [Thermomicrobiaceae bacterium]
MEIADLICSMIGSHRVIELFRANDPTGQSRLVEPHAVYIGSNSRGFVDFWQLSGWSWSEQALGWRRLALTDVIDVRPQDARFEPRADYRPDNRQWYRAFVCTAGPVPVVDEQLPGDAEQG